MTVNTNFSTTHYANMSVQYTAIFHGCKNDNFQMKFFDIFLIFAQNIDCGYTLEPPQRGGSNEYPQSVFCSKNKKKCIPQLTLVLLYKSGVQGGVRYMDLFFVMSSTTHYANMPMHYTAIFNGCKNNIFWLSGRYDYLFTPATPS